MRVVESGDVREFDLSARSQEFFRFLEEGEI